MEQKTKGHFINRYDEYHGQNRDISKCKKQKQVYRKKKLKYGKIEFNLQTKKHESH